VTPRQRFFVYAAFEHLLPAFPYHTLTLTNQPIPLRFAMADQKLTEYVTLVSSDDFEFKVLRSAACIAGAIKKALDPTCE
jgi:hypothetical protein